MGVSKVVYGNRTLIDLTKTNVSPEKLYKGATAVSASGDVIEGEVDPANCFFEADDNTNQLPLGNSTISLEVRQSNLFFKTATGTYEIGTMSFKET